MRAPFLFLAACCATLALTGAAEARKGFSFGGSARAAPSPARTVPAVRTTPAPAPAAASSASGGRPVGLFVYRPASTQPQGEQQQKEAASAAAGPARPAVIQPAAMSVPSTGVPPQRFGEPPQETRSAPGFRSVN